MESVAPVGLLTRCPRSATYEGYLIETGWGVLFTFFALGLALVALPPAIMYASTMIQVARQGEPEPSYTYVFDHYPIQAASVLVIPLATALLALRLPGWRPMMFLVASGTAWFGVVSIVYPDHLGSWGTAWGWTAVAWVAALCSLAFRWSPRRRAAETDGAEPGKDEELASR